MLCFDTHACLSMLQPLTQVAMPLGMRLCITASKVLHHSTYDALGCVVTKVCETQSMSLKAMLACMD